MDREKARLRAWARETLAALDARARAESDGAIVQNLLQSGLWRAAKSVFCYVGDTKRGEIDTLPLLRAALAAGKTLAVPLCTGKGRMEAHVLHTLEALRPGRYGLLEPPAESVLLAPEHIALCVTPCLAAAPDGTRLGWGGGYYDRFLPRAEHAVTVTLCRAATLLPALAREGHDVRTAYLVTEQGVCCCAQAAEHHYNTGRR